MTDQSCPLPSDPTPTQAQIIKQLLDVRRVAVVGLSDDPSRPSHGVGQYLMEHDYDIIPVNPSAPTVLGRQSYKSLADVPRPIDLVLVFRRPEHCADVARQAVAAGAGGLWLQAGIRSDEAQSIARDASIPFVQDRCMMVEHMRTK